MPSSPLNIWAHSTSVLLKLFVRRNRFQRLEPRRSDESSSTSRRRMKSGNTSKITAIAVVCLSLGMYALAQKGPGAGGGSQMTQPQQNPSSVQQNQSMQSRQNTATTSPTASPLNSPHATGTAQAQQHVKTSPTPRGHHYGWQKGKHNPHRSPTASPSASVTPSATASATATATASATSTATATATTTPTGTP